MYENNNTKAIDIVRHKVKVAAYKEEISIMTIEMLRKRMFVSSENVYSLLVETLIEVAFCKDRKEAIENAYLAVSAAHDICEILIGNYEYPNEQLSETRSDLKEILENFEGYLENGFDMPIIENINQKNGFTDREEVRKWE